MKGRGNPVNVAPKLTTINTLAIAEQQTAFTITHARLLANSNAADVNNDLLSFRIESQLGRALRARALLPVVPSSVQVIMSESSNSSTSHLNT